MVYLFLYHLGLTLKLTNTPIELCKCNNAWLKKASDEGAIVQVDDKDCNGNLWSSMRSADLLAVCAVTPVFAGPGIKSHLHISSN